MRPRIWGDDETQPVKILETDLLTGPRPRRRVPAWRGGRSPGSTGRCFLPRDGGCRSRSYSGLRAPITAWRLVAQTLWKRELAAYEVAAARLEEQAMVRGLLQQAAVHRSPGTQRERQHMPGTMPHASPELAAPKGRGHPGG